MDQLRTRWQAAGVIQALGEKKLHVILIRHRDLVHSFSTQARVHEVPLLPERPGDSIYLTL